MKISPSLPTEPRSSLEVSSGVHGFIRKGRDFNPGSIELLCGCITLNKLLNTSDPRQNGAIVPKSSGVL